MNRAEQFVADLCGRSFLSLWSYLNPQGKEQSKELCDCLVICEPDVIIFSVKEVRPAESGSASVDWQRWRRRAVDASVKQIYGAERVLASMDHAITREGNEGPALPDAPTRRVHRVAVALGGEGKFTLSSGDFGKGYVHVLDETSFGIIIQELDTITDFVGYLRAKEAVRARLVLEGGGEEDLLAFYLTNGRCFPDRYDMIGVGADLWTTFSNSPEYRAKRGADRASYLWDELIEEVCGDYREGRLVAGQSFDTVEPTLRVMAQEDRFCRRVLAKSLLEFLQLNREQQVRSRISLSASGTLYVFLACPLGTERDDRRKELFMRCFVARGRFRDRQTVVGIATEQQEGQKGHSLDLVRFDKPTWTAGDTAAMKKIQKDLGYFAKPVHSRAHEDEYPQP